MMRIEVTYLCKELPLGLEKVQHEKIVQGYLSNRPDAVRIRRKGNTYSITRKKIVVPGDFSFRDYISLEIFGEEFEKIWPLMVKTLQKTRYYFSKEYGGPEVRIDVFEGDLKGLVLTELIFANEDDLRNFKKPEWFSADVTASADLNNPSVAGKKFKDLEPIIKKYSELKVPNQ